jgi:hypothetical protein
LLASTISDPLVHAGKFVRHERHKGTERLGQLEADGQIVNCNDVRNRSPTCLGEAGLVLVQGPVGSKLDIRGSEVGAVMTLHALLQFEGDGEAIVAHFPFARQ